MGHAVREHDACARRYLYCIQCLRVVLRMDIARGFRPASGNVLTLADDQYEGGYGYGHEGRHRQGDPVPLWV